MKFQNYFLIFTQNSKIVSKKAPKGNKMENSGPKRSHRESKGLVLGVAFLGLAGVCFLSPGRTEPSLLPGADPPSFSRNSAPLPAPLLPGPARQHTGVTRVLHHQGVVPLTASSHTPCNYTSAHTALHFPRLSHLILTLQAPELRKAPVVQRFLRLKFGFFLIDFFS